jgi:hypothetical protein
MITENEGNTPAEPTIEELKSKIVRLEQQLSWAEQAKSNKADKLTKAKLLVQTSIDNEEWTDSELEEPFWEELCEILDVELNKTYEVIIKAEWSATLRGPRNMSISDIADYININEPTVTSYVSVDIDDIYEREVDITEA